jgi:two-component system OmpR family sensor kinase
VENTSRLFWPWVAFATLCCALMFRFSGNETIPYHFAWIAIAVAYGLEPWPRSKAYVAVVGLTVVSGVILVYRATTGVIAWAEIAEVPLMSLLMAVLVWHVRRRYDAMATLTAVSEREQLRARQRERLSRMTSHEMRTPATIAVGYLELLLASERDPAKRDDLSVVLEELDRVLLGSERMVRMLWIPELDDMEKVDIDASLAEILARWRVLADRNWQVCSASGVQDGSPGRIRSCMDTLLENSVRYTEPGDVVRLVSFVRDGLLCVGVEDSGPGFDPDVARVINEAQTPAEEELAASVDPKRQTGLGLGLVREAISGRGGRIQVGRSPEGGAQVLMVAPGLDRPLQPVAPPARVRARSLGDDSSLSASRGQDRTAARASTRSASVTGPSTRA